MNTIKKIGAVPLALALMLVGGAVAGYTSLASAQTPTTSTTAAQTSTTPQRDPSQGGHVGSNGMKEELLTGTTAERVTTAALAAVPGGTIERVETDAEGAAYEAHMTKSDGSHVTVKFDSNFNVTGTESGHGARPTQQ